MSEEASPEVELNLVSDQAIHIGIALALICVLLACSLIVWVLVNRKSPVVKAMQPIFLIMLCFGTIMTSSSIFFLGVDESSKIDADRACMVYPWLHGVGDTVALSSLFTKLWRVNQVFHAERFERKVVTVKRVLWPLAIFVALDLGLLLVATLVDPIGWVRKPLINDDDNNNETVCLSEITELNNYGFNETIGRCGHCNQEGEVWNTMVDIVDLINLFALVILCVQAYRARDVRSEFSEARGVALALFSWLQIMIIAAPIQGLLEAEAEPFPTILYALEVLTAFMANMVLLLFIFVPLVYHQRKFRREGGTMNVHRITGVEGGPENSTGASQIGDLRSVEELHNARNRISELEKLVASLNEKLALRDDIESQQRENDEEK